MEIRNRQHMKKYFLRKHTYHLLVLLFVFITGNGQPKQKTHGSDTASQISENIHSIMQDKTGNYWFGTDGDGVCRYNGKSFTYFTVTDGLCSNFVRTIQEDNTGNIWFGTRDGVCRYDGKSFITFTDKEDLSKIGSLGNVWQNVHIPRSGLWFGTGDGAYRYDGKSFTFMPLPIADADIKLRQSQPAFIQTAYSVYCIFEDKTGNIWFGTEQRGVCRFDGKSFTWFTEKDLDKAAVRCIYQDKTGDLWFVNNGAGVCRYDGKSVTNFTEEKGLGNKDFPRTLKSKIGTLARVFTMTEDNAGNIWFGTVDAGAWRYDSKSLTNFTNKDGITSNTIWTIYKDNAGDLWFGTGGGGVCKFDGRSFTNFTKDKHGRR
jgi:ligand-binding sensor domain-containing protein